VLDKKTRWIFFSQTSKNQPLGTPRRLRFWAKIAFFHYEPLPKRVSDFFFDGKARRFFSIFLCTRASHHVTAAVTTVATGRGGCGWRWRWRWRAATAAAVAVDAHTAAERRTEK
jgi:hypothetical protein